MKICILGDTHFGARNDSVQFHDIFAKFYSETLIPTLQEMGVDTIIQLGDLFERRKYINFNSLHLSKKYFFDPLKNNNIQLYTLIGNHDIFWRESLSINSQSLVLGEYDNIHIFDTPKTISLGGVSMDIIPWICEENRQEVLGFINSSRSKVCLGHFEIHGFSMYQDAESTDGLSREIFKNYNQVLSGHYHHKSFKHNITYVGTPYEMTWEDYGDVKGFNILDLDSLKMEFHENPHRMFFKIQYSDDLDEKSIDYTLFKDKYVKVVVVSKSDHYKFDKFLNMMYNSNPFDLKIIDEVIDTSSSIDENIDLKDTKSVISDYITKIETQVDKEKLTNFMKSLYVEAINMEV